MRQPESLFPSDATLPLLTDLYELTMAAGYFVTGKREGWPSRHSCARCRRTGRTWWRRGWSRHCTVSWTCDLAGSRVLHGCGQLPQFQTLPGEFFDYLEQLPIPRGRLGDARGDGGLRRRAAGAGRKADLIEAQILETYLLTCLNLQTLVASKAARIVPGGGAAAGRGLRSRRAHGPQAGLLAARAAIIGGCAGTSNVEAATGAGRAGRRDDGSFVDDGLRGRG